jgi:hypothetical protein
MSFYVVTAYYPLNKSKHSADSYRKWIRNFFQCVSAPIVCFVPHGVMHEFERYKRENVHFIEREFHSFDMMNAAQMSAFQQWHQHDPEKQIHSAELYAIWAAKQEFVHIASSLFDADLYIWCDIGCFREVMDGSFRTVGSHVAPGKMTVLSIEDHNMKRVDGSNLTIGGGVLAGHKDTWATFRSLYLQELNRSIHGKDQVIYKRILNASNANIIPARNNDWFFLIKYLSREMK